MSKKGLVYKGFVCNYLEVISDEKILKNGTYYHHCRCKCGNERTVSYSALAYQRIQDCGCGLYALDQNKKKYIGQKFNSLTVIDCLMKPYQKTNKTFARCRCDCGNIKDFHLCELKAGHFKSCGCIKYFDFDRDYKNKMFHNIEVLELINEEKKIVKCRCHCGSVFEMPLIDLLKKTRYLISCKYCNDGVHHKYNKSKKEELHFGDIKTVFYTMKNRCYNKKSDDYKWYGGKGIKICQEWLNDTNKFVEWALQSGYQKGLTIDRIDSDGNYEPSNCRWTDMETQNNNKKKLKKYNFNGEYLTLSQISRKINIKYRTLLGRINKGWDIEKAIKTPVKGKDG